MKKVVSILLAAVVALSPATLLAQTQPQMMELMQQLTQLEKEMRQLRGEVERLSYENKRLKSQQNDFYMDLDQRLGTLEKTGAGQNLVAGPAMGTQPQVISTMPVSAPSNAGTSAVSNQPGSLTAQTPPALAATIETPSVPMVAADPAMEQADYKAAFNLLKLGKYEEAITAYNQFLQKYPAGNYASNAQYWLGEANYVTRNFDQAIADFRKVVSSYPDSRKLPDAMLKIGYIHYELKESEAARKVLTELKQKFPGTTASRLAENRLQRMKLEGR